LKEGRKTGAIANVFITGVLPITIPQGRSDLEFIGKYHEKFAGMRWVIEFKYFSNAELQRMKTSIEDFTLRPEDTEQLAGYVDGLRREYPEAKIFQYVIYCFGNQGYRVFRIG